MQGGFFMKQHVLLENAYVYENVPQNLLPEDCSYDRQGGFWRADSTGEAMMVSDYAKKPTSKKCDVETGEDQKGE